MKKILFLTILAICLSATGCMKNMRKNTTKILMVVPPEQIMDVEYQESRKLFDKKGANVKVASTKMGTLTGEKLSIKADLLIKDAKSSDYDAIVLIGGMGIFKHIVDNADLQKLVKEMNSQGKYVCAICGSSVVLAKTGILKSKKATTYPDAGLIELMKKSGAIYVTDTTVVSGRIVTGNGPGASKQFAEVVSKAIGL